MEEGSVLGSEGRNTALSAPVLDAAGSDGRRVVDTVYRRQNGGVAAAVAAPGNA